MISVKGYTSVGESTLKISSKSLMCAEEKENPGLVEDIINYHEKALGENSFLGGPQKMAFKRH